jgi:hypothetical protein
MLYEHAIGELLQYVSLQGTRARREVGVRRVGLRREDLVLECWA